MQLKMMLGRESAWMSLYDADRNQCRMVKNGNNDDFPLYFQIIDNHTKVLVGRVARSAFRDEIKFKRENGSIGDENSNAQCLGPEFMHTDSHYFFQGQDYPPSHLILALLDKAAEFAKKYRLEIDSIKLIAHPCWNAEELESMKCELQNLCERVEIGELRNEMPDKNAFYALIFDDGMQIGYWDNDGVWISVKKAPNMGHDIRTEKMVDGIIQWIRSAGGTLMDAGKNLEPLERMAGRIYIEENDVFAKLDSGGAYQGDYNSPTTRRCIRIAFKSDDLVDYRGENLLKGVANDSFVKLEANEGLSKSIFFIGDAFNFEEFKSVFSARLGNNYSLKFFNTNAFVDFVFTKMCSPELIAPILKKRNDVQPPSVGKSAQNEFVEINSVEVESLQVEDLVVMYTCDQKTGRQIHKVFRCLGNSCFIIEESNRDSFPIGMTVKALDSTWQVGRQQRLMPLDGMYANQVGLTKSIYKICEKRKSPRLETASQSVSEIDISSCPCGAVITIYAGHSIHKFKKVSETGWEIVESTSNNLRPHVGELVYFAESLWRLGGVVRTQNLGGYHSSALNKIEILSANEHEYEGSGFQIA